MLPEREIVNQKYLLNIVILVVIVGGLSDILYLEKILKIEQYY